MIRNMNPVATHCAVCRQRLDDSKSVELGIGPHCAKRYGYGLDVSEDARRRANELVLHVAYIQSGLDKPRLTDEIKAACGELRLLGFTVLAERIEHNSTSRRKPTPPTVFINDITDGYAVITPWCKEAVGDWRNIPGRRWDRESKFNRVPADAKAALWALLRKFFVGHTALGPKGEFVIE